MILCLAFLNYALIDFLFLEIQRFHMVLRIADVGNMESRNRGRVGGGIVISYRSLGLCGNIVRRGGLRQPVWGGHWRGFR